MSTLIISVHSFLPDTSGCVHNWESFLCFKSILALFRFLSTIGYRIQIGMDHALIPAGSEQFTSKLRVTMQFSQETFILAIGLHKEDSKTNPSIRT